MGIKAAFNPQIADFDRISDTALVISDVLQSVSTVGVVDDGYKQPPHTWSGAMALKTILLFACADG